MAGRRITHFDCPFYGRWLGESSQAWLITHCINSKSQFIIQFFIQLVDQPRSTKHVQYWKTSLSNIFEHKTKYITLQTKTIRNPDMISWFPEVECLWWVLIRILDVWIVGHVNGGTLQFCRAFHCPRILIIASFCCSNGRRAWNGSA